MNSAHPTGGRVAREMPIDSEGNTNTKTVGFSVNFTAECDNAGKRVSTLELPQPRPYRRPLEYPPATGEGHQ